jgi:LacI family transcriptional regulator
MIGYVMPTGATFDLDPHFVEFLSGLGDFARSHNIDLVISPADAHDQTSTYRRVLANRQVDALFVSSPGPTDHRIKLLNQSSVPYIVHGRSEGLDFAYPHMDIDNEGAFFQAARLLVELRHRKIAFINDEVFKTFAIHRERGVHRALAMSNLDLPPSATFSLPMTDESGYKAARSLLEGPNPPTAILCVSLLMAIGVFRAIRELNLKIPDDVSVIAHDDVFPWLKPENFSVPLTTTRSSIRAAGVRVAERLVARMSGVEVEPVAEVWPVDLIVRASVAAAP